LDSPTFQNPPGRAAAISAPHLRPRSLPPRRRQEARRPRRPSNHTSTEEPVMDSP
jgi:hypothetical protein